MVLSAVPPKKTDKKDEVEDEVNGGRVASKSFSVQAIQLPSLPHKSYEAEDIYNTPAELPEKAVAEVESISSHTLPQYFSGANLLLMGSRGKKASRPPGLSTVFHSPISEVRSNSLPMIPLDKIITSSMDEDDRFLGSIHGANNKGVVIEAQCRDTPDGDDTSSNGNEDDGKITHVPQRRHVSYSMSVTGSSCVAFSIMDKYKKQTFKTEVLH